VGRQEIGELQFTSVGRSEVRGSLVNKPIKIEDDGLVDSKVDNLVKIEQSLNF